MKLEILSENLLRHAGSGPRFDLSTLAPGDLLQARIVGTTPDGRTLLQFPQFRAVSDQALAGRVGSRIDFEVIVRSETSESRMLQLRLAADNQDVHSARTNPAAFQLARTPSVEALPARHGSTAREGNQRTAETQPARPGDDVSGGGARGALEASATAPVAAEPIRRWLGRLRQAFQRGNASGPARSETAPRHTREGHALTQNEKALAEESERPGAAAAAATRQAYWFHGMEGLRLPIRMEIAGQPGGGRRGSDRAPTSAALLLEFDSLGPVRVDLRMHAARLWVDFGVASAEARQIVLAHLSEVDGPLRRLASEGVCCRVRVQGDADNAAHTAEADAGGVDLRI